MVSYKEISRWEIGRGGPPEGFPSDTKEHMEHFHKFDKNIRFPYHLSGNTSPLLLDTNIATDDIGVHRKDTLTSQYTNLTVFSLVLELGGSLVRIHRMCYGFPGLNFSCITFVYMYTY